MTDLVGEALRAVNGGCGAAGLEVLCLGDVKPKSIEWLWKDRLAVGKVTVLAGDGGQGKSTILCDLAARTTTGELWPDGIAGCAPGGVIILAAEDDVEDTLVPRLIAAGADMSRIFNIRSVRETRDGDMARRSFSLQADLAMREAEIRKRAGIKLVIIDPVTSYLGKVDSHKNAEVRTVLEPLGELAARCRVAIICNNHFSKGTGNANSRIIGSVAFVNQARAAFIVAPDAENEDRMFFMPSKMNIGPKGDSLAYRIEGCLIDGDGTEIVASRIGWELSPVTSSADEVLAALAGGDEHRTAKAEAIEFLRDALGKGPRPAGDVQREVREAGIAAKPLRAAGDALCVTRGKSGFEGGWVWTLPKMPSSPEDARAGTWASSDP